MTTEGRLTRNRKRKRGKRERKTLDERGLQEQRGRTHLIVKVEAVASDRGCKKKKKGVREGKEGKRRERGGGEAKRR